MSAAWTLHNLTTAASGSVGDFFGFSDPVLEVANQDVSALTLERSGSLDDPWQFQEGDRILLLRDEVVWFAGNCLPGAMNGSPNSESASYRIVDDFYALSKTVYRQRWVGNLPATSATGGYWSGHLMLNYDPSSGWLTTRGQVLEALNYATNTDTDGPNGGCSIPFDWDETEFPNQIVWQEEVRNVTILEAVRKQLKFFPQTALYFDYSAASATGRPLLHCATYDDLTPVTMPLAASAGDSTHETVSVSRVWEQEIPSCHILFEKTGTVTIGDETKSYLTVYADIAPTGSHGFEVGALHSCVSLMGATSASIQQTIYTRPFNAAAGDSGADSASGNAERVAWWKRHVPMFQDAASITVRGVSLFQRGPSGDWVANTQPVLANELADGTWSEWMPIAGGTTTPSSCYEVGVSGAISYKRMSRSNGKIVESQTVVPYFGAVNLTNVSGGEGGTQYTAQTAYEADEPTPVGLADHVYQALKGPLFSGQVTYVAQECDALGGTLNMGCKVSLDMRNATGGADTTNADYALWRAMGATVQKIRYELETGKTTVSFGPPKHLGVPDLIELLRQGRFRQKWSNSRLLSGGDLSSAAVQAGDRVFKDIANKGQSTPSISQHSAEVGTGAGGTAFGTINFGAGPVNV